MSPVARRRRGAHTGRALTVAIVGVVVALGTAFAFASLASRGDVEVRLGDDRFNAGRTDELLDAIVRQGAPLGFNDVATFDRPIWVDNAGGDETRGWIAIGAFLPDDPTCLVQWEADVERYVAECDSAISFPRSGAGLRLYPVEVDGGRLFVNLQTEAP